MFTHPSIEIFLIF